MNISKVKRQIVYLEKNVVMIDMINGQLMCPQYLAFYKLIEKKKIKPRGNDVKDYSQAIQNQEIHLVNNQMKKL